MILTFDIVELPINKVMLLFLQLRHDFTVSAAQLLKSGPEVILKCRKTVKGSTKGKKVQSKKKKKRRKKGLVFV